MPANNTQPPTKLGYWNPARRTYAGFLFGIFPSLVWWIGEYKALSIDPAQTATLLAIPTATAVLMCLLSPETRLVQTSQGWSIQAGVAAASQFLAIRRSEVLPNSPLEIKYFTAMPRTRHPGWYVGIQTTRGMAWYGCHQERSQASRQRRALQSLLNP